MAPAVQSSAPLLPPSSDLLRFLTSIGSSRINRMMPAVDKNESWKVIDKNKPTINIILLWLDCTAVCTHPLHAWGSVSSTVNTISDWVPINECGQIELLSEVMLGPVDIARRCSNITRLFACAYKYVLVHQLIMLTLSLNAPSLCITGYLYALSLSLCGCRFE